MRRSAEPRRTTTAALRGRLTIVAWIAAVGIAAALALVSSTSVRAGSGSTWSLPKPGVTNTSGLRINVDSRWVDGDGYRPVRVEVIPTPGPAPADRTLRIAFSQQPPQYQGRPQSRVEQTIEVPQGSTRVEATVAVLQHQTLEYLAMDVFEGGRRLEALSTSLPMPQATRTRLAYAAGVPLLVIDSDAPAWDERELAIARSFAPPTAEGRDYRSSFDLPDLSQLMDLYGGGVSMPAIAGGTARPTDATILTGLSRAPYVELLPPQALPLRWIDYTSLVAAAISRSDAVLMAEQFPEQWGALCEWVRCGGWLLVYGVDGAFGDLDRDELARLLHIDALRVDGTMQSQSDAGAQSVRLGSVLAERAIGVRCDWYDVGTGSVGLSAFDDPFAALNGFWNPYGNTGRGRFGQAVLRGESRYGYSFAEGASDFWDYAIPGAGRAPVGSFLVLITLFAVLVGPVNYVLLRRAKRLHAMLVTVPAGAAAATLGLIVYALLWEGLGVQTSVHSFTQLDQQQGHAVSWSRQSYYAALAPTRGLSFPVDAAVFPVAMGSSEYTPLRATAFDGARPRTMRWGDDQRLASGYLASRRLAQFLVIASGPSEARLVVTLPSGEEAARVENRVGTMIERLVLRGRDGTYYACDAIADGATADVPRIESNRAPLLVRRWYEERRRADDIPLVDGYTSASATSASSSGLLPHCLEATGTQGGMRLEPGTFLAVVEHSPAVPLGVKEPRQRDSFHVVVGRW